MYDSPNFSLSRLHTRWWQSRNTPLRLFLVAAAVTYLIMTHFYQCVKTILHDPTQSSPSNLSPKEGQVLKILSCVLLNREGEQGSAALLVKRECEYIHT